MPKKIVNVKGEMVFDTYYTWTLSKTNHNGLNTQILDDEIMNIHQHYLFFFFFLKTGLLDLKP